MLFLIMVLLISNVILVFFLFINDKKVIKDKTKKEDYAMKVYKEIGLTQIQIDTFKIRKEDFFKNMKPLWNEIKVLKDSLYMNMEKGNTDSFSIEMISRIGKKSKKADSLMFAHFTELRTLCTEDQQIRFDTIIPKLVNRSWNRNKK